MPALANDLVLVAITCDRDEGSTSSNGGTGAGAARAVELRARAAAIASAVGMQSITAERWADAEPAWLLRRADDSWVLEAGPERALFRDARGLHSLRALLSAPGCDVAALDLGAGGRGLAPPPLEAAIDEPAEATYRRRLHELEAELDAADRAGDRDRGETVGC